VRVHVIIDGVGEQRGPGADPENHPGGRPPRQCLDVAPHVVAERGPAGVRWRRVRCLVLRGQNVRERDGSAGRAGRRREIAGDDGGEGAADQCRRNVRRLLRVGERGARISVHGDDFRRKKGAAARDNESDAASQ